MGAHPRPNGFRVGKSFVGLSTETVRFRGGAPRCPDGRRGGEDATKRAHGKRAGLKGLEGLVGLWNILCLYTLRRSRNRRIAVYD